MIVEANGTSGVTLDSAIVCRSLQELNRDINFDVAQRLEEWDYAMVSPKALRAKMDATRMPVLHLGRYICAMDRGPIPEFKQWSVVERVVEVPWSEADKEESSITYQTIPPTAENYRDLYIEAALGKRLDLQLLPDGKLVRTVCTAVRKTRGKIVRLGWRHTFNRLIAAEIHGVTRGSVSAKFGVDLMKYPLGAPEELFAELVEE